MKDGFKTLKFKKATVVRDGKTLLGPLSFSVQSSGITAILGHNGAGKSLLLKLCHGQFSPSEGEVLWNDLSAESTRKCRSFMFQNTPLLRRSVACNVEFPLIAHGVPMCERPALVANALIKARLKDHANTPAARLSGGERQRLALARAWVTRPQVILLDEPAASLDPASTKELEGMVKAIAATGVKVFIATHDLQQAQRLADDALVFGGGKLLAAEKTNTLFNMPRIGPVADFLSGKL